MSDNNWVRSLRSSSNATAGGLKNKRRSVSGLQGINVLDQGFTTKENRLPPVHVHKAGNLANLKRRSSVSSISEEIDAVKIRKLSQVDENVVIPNIKGQNALDIDEVDEVFAPGKSVAGKVVIGQKIIKTGNPVQIPIIGEEKKSKLAKPLKKNPAATKRQYGKSLSRPNLLLPSTLGSKTLQVDKEKEPVIVSPIPLPAGVICIDPTDRQDVDCWPDFVKYLRSIESNWVIQVADLEKDNPDLRRNRSILMDWILEICYFFRFCQETLYHTVAIIDRTLSRHKVNVEHFQLVAMSAVLIAAKLEEYHPPRVFDLLKLSAHSYKQEEVIGMERKLLKILDMSVHIADPMVFLNRFIRAAIKHQDTRFKNVTLLFFDCLITSLEYSSLPASKKAAAAVFAARLVMDMPEEKEEFVRWTPTLEFYTGYTVDQVYFLAFQMIDILLRIQREIEAGPRKNNGSVKNGIVIKYMSRSQHEQVFRYVSVQRLEDAMALNNDLSDKEISAKRKQQENKELCKH